MAKIRKNTLMISNNATTSSEESNNSEAIDPDYYYEFSLLQNRNIANNINSQIFEKPKCVDVPFSKYIFIFPN